MRFRERPVVIPRDLNSSNIGLINGGEPFLFSGK